MFATAMATSMAVLFLFTPACVGHVTMFRTLAEDSKHEEYIDVQLLQTDLSIQPSERGTAPMTRKINGTDITQELALSRKHDNSIHFRLPTLLYIGIGHSGSTSLAESLNLHPELDYGQMKEHGFFASGPHGSGRLDTIWDYYSTFPVGSDVLHAFDATPTTLFMGNENACTAVNEEHLGCARPMNFFHSPGIGAVRALRDILGPNLLLIAMFRNPAEYMCSRISTQRSQSESEINTSAPCFNATEAAQLTWRWCYADSLKPWLDIYPRDNFLFLRSEDYFDDSKHVLDTVFEFAGVSPFENNETMKTASSSGRRRLATTHIAETRTASRRVMQGMPRYSECKERLQQMTGLQFDWDQEN